jgi:hypothetical protein
MRVVFQKADLDTCLTAIVCGVAESDEIAAVAGPAAAEELADAMVLCIEAGGSGQMHLNNFDHHDPQRYFPPACRQAFDHKGVTDAGLLRLVRYVCDVDEARPIAPPVGYPSLSNLFSGMRSFVPDAMGQFTQGNRLLRQVWHRGLDPYRPLPMDPSWEPYRAAFDQARRRVQTDMQNAQFSDTAGGLKIGFACSDAPGLLGALYARGSHIAVAFNPRTGKYTIGSTRVPLVDLLPYLNALENGWGGREKVLGSKPASRVDAPSLLKVIAEVL